MSLTNLKVNKFSIFIALIIFLSLDCFYLVDTSTLPVDTDDMTLLVEVAFAAYVFCKCGFQGKNRYAIWYLIPIILMFTSSIMGHLNYAGQPLWYGIRAQRHWVIALLMYFPLNQLIKSERYTVEDLLDLLDKLMLVYCILVIAQYFLGDSVTLIQVKTNERYSSIRLYVTTAFIEISFFCHLNRIIKGLKAKFMDIFMICACLFILFFVTKSRMGMVSVAGAIIIFLASMKLTKRKLGYITFAVVVVCIFLSTSAGQAILESIVGLGSGGDQDTSLIREIGRQFYMEEILSSPLKFVFGEGFANSDWTPALSITRITDNIYYVDNGIFGLIFYYGFSFVFWMAGAYITLMRDAWKNKSRGVFFYLLYGLLGMYSLLPACYSAAFVFAIAGAVIENGEVVEAAEADEDDIDMIEIEESS